MVITRQEPDRVYHGLPCSMVAVGCAKGLTNIFEIEKLRSPLLKEDGYLTLQGGNRLVRDNLDVKKRTDFRRNERPTLQEYIEAHPDSRAVICVLGHLLYYEGNGTYWSFFENEDDPVVAVWELK